ncbi:universal stress protein [Methyloligella sp. 2.7D]|uniref:universal stress protein n=1 Tax=unclassified Methyloligella TaxID=2625955 RepID=UPI00157CE01A|nr:universal stress protein [Methyloligella sp. GL2]QKP76974.1 universal stress protein [Methyloligella sp. GL2]
METYKEILVHIPAQDGEEQLKAGVGLAKRYGAHLTGVTSLIETAMVRNTLATPFVNADEDEAAKIMTREEERAHEAERRFNAAAEAAGISHSWFACEGNPADILIRACRLKDIAIVEQCTPGSDLIWGPAVQLALSDQPTLIVPNDWDAPIAERHAVVTWNGSAQAAEAVQRSIPLLQSAGTATLVEGPSPETLPQNLRMPAPDVVKYLERHDVRVEKYGREIPGPAAGEAILKIADEKSADLVVMGAFGRSRFREWVLGGATRYVLEHMNVPVFMAH